MRSVLLWMAVVALSACTRDDPVDSLDVRGSATGLRYLRAGAEQGFSRAIEPRALQFPADHGNHPDFQTEWWYFTGNLEAEDDRELGFELTFFRFALGPDTATAGASTWRSNQVWMAHLALTDAATRRFFARERMAREALGLSGASADPLRVWVKSWSMQALQSGAELDLHLEAHDPEFGLALDLTTRDVPIAHGEQGLDRKGPEPGNASYYYSVPGLAARGAVTIDGRVLPVVGSAWMDREWSTSALSPDVAGWDWFALRLSDGGSLMFYRLRRHDGSASPFSAGTLIGVDGTRSVLGAEDVELSPLRHWTSRETRARYPVAWSLRIPAAGLSLVVEPILDEQELNLSVRYWEGAMRASGTRDAERLTAVGYLELTGY